MSALLVVIGGGAAVVAVMGGGSGLIDAAGRGSTADAPVGGLGGPAGAQGGQATAAPGGLGLGGPVGVPAGALGGRLGDADDKPGVTDRESTAAGLRGVGAQRQAAAGPLVAGPGAPAAVAGPPIGNRAPVITTRTVSETRSIPFDTQMVRDPDLRRGQQRVDVEGIDGEQTLRWLVTLTDGRQTGRRLIDSTVTRQPEPQIIAVGGRGRGGWDRDPDRGRGHGGHHRECDACVSVERRACTNDSPPGAGDRGFGNVDRLMDQDLAPLHPAVINDLELICAVP